MRRRHQEGSLQKRKRATGWAWIGMWRGAHGRRLSRNLGKYPVVSKAEAQARLEGEIAEVNQGVADLSRDDLRRFRPKCAPAILPPEVKSVYGFNFGAADQFSSDFRVRQHRTSEDEARSVAGFSRPEGQIRPVVQRRGSPAVGLAGDLRTGDRGRPDRPQPSKVAVYPEHGRASFQTGNDGRGGNEMSVGT